MASPALSRAAQTGLLTRRSPLMKLKGDEQLVALVRAGNPGAFDAIVDRYQPRLLGFCRQMLGSTEDAEDVLQEVMVNAHKAMLADNREIKLKPWLYRIARNRSLNHLRRPKAEAKESMDMVPMAEEASTAAKVHNREEFRQLLSDVTRLPETQRAALMLREIEGLSYEEIAEAMETSIPSVKSLLVRARISLAESSQARALTCGEVKVELAEAAEGLAKVSGPVRRHVKDCDGCGAFRAQLRSDSKTLAMLVPVGPLIALKMAIASKLGLGGGGAAVGTSAGAGAAGSAAGVTGAAAGAGGAASGLGAVGSAVGLKAVAGVATAAVITAGAVEVRKAIVTDRATAPAGPTMVAKPNKTPPAPVATAADQTDAGTVTVAAVVEPEPTAVPASTPPPVEAVTTPPPTSTGTPSTGGLEGTVVEVPAEPVPPEVVDPPLPPVEPEEPAPTPTPEAPPVPSE